LQQRLQVICWIITAAVVGQAIVVLAFVDLVPSRLPAVAGSPARSLVIGGLFLAAALALGSSRQHPLRTLRGVEVAVFALSAWEIIALNWFDYGTLHGVYERAPIDIALGQTSYWVGTMVLYATLIPNTARRTAVVLSVFVAVPLAVHTLALQLGLLPAAIAALVIVSSALMLLIVAASLTFGSFRYELAVRREEAARELGQYTLGERLGRGGMGEVFRGEHRLLRRPVAIKLISPEQAGSPEVIERFEREAQAAALLTHPNTVQVFDYGRADDGTFYCVMEYLPGASLDEIVCRDGPLPAARAVRVLTQLCGAVAEAHARGLVHRDIKPGNVMLGERGGITDVAKLLDFGLVITRRPGQDEARLTRAGMILGTPEYMSPEQCGEDAAAVGPASDLYSLGALGYFLVTSRSPFAGRGAVQMLAAHLYESPMPPSAANPAVPPALDAVLLRCLAKKPEERFPDAMSLSHALQEAVL
jgi:serine/threonine-protein kinase